MKKAKEFIQVSTIFLISALVFFLLSIIVSSVMKDNTRSLAFRDMGIVMIVMIIGIHIVYLFENREKKNKILIEPKPMVESKSWEEFRATGLLWWINTMLHTFGYSIVINVEKDGTIFNAYPARVKFRGFDEENNTKGYIKVSQYLKDNIEEILEESKE